MPDSTPPAESVGLAPPILPDHPPLYRHLDPAAALAFRTPLQEHPPAADTKAAAMMTALGIMFPILSKFAYHFEGSIREIRHHDSTWGLVSGCVTLLLLAAFLVYSGLTLWHAFSTLWPRFPRAVPSLAFFGDIAHLSREDYIARVESLTHDEALEQILHYNYTLSGICVEKFRQLGKGIKYFWTAAACWLALMAILLAMVEHQWPER